MINALRGMQDLQGLDAFLYQKIIKVCEELATNFGFSYIGTPHLEQSALFRRSVGESSDIVGKEMYEFTDKGGNAVCLRPEGTAGIVRAYIEAKFDKMSTAKRWFYHGSMFRYERPQRGRLREFHQFGVESFGVKSVFEDANLIFLLVQILEKLEISATLKINSLGCEKCLPEFRTKFLKFVDDKKGFCEDCVRRKALNVVRMLDCKKEHCQNLLKDAPILRDCLCDECKSDFKNLQSLLKAGNLAFKVDDKLVRGLDYYSKTAFEFESDEIGAKAAVAGGGRYDRLISYLGGKVGFGVGFALGIERLIEILKSRENEIKRDGIYLCTLDTRYLKDIFALALNLRKNFKVNLNYEAKKLAKHLNQADLSKALIFLCIGENEAKNKSIFYKNLENKDEKMIKIEDLEKNLRA